MSALNVIDYLNWTCTSLSLFYNKFTQVSPDPEIVVIMTLLYYECIIDVTTRSDVYFLVIDKQTTRLEVDHTFFNWNHIVVAATLYKSTHLFELLQMLCLKVFFPLTVYIFKHISVCVGGLVTTLYGHAHLGNNLVFCQCILTPFPLPKIDEGGFSRSLS